MTHRATNYFEVEAPLAEGFKRFGILPFRHQKHLRCPWLEWHLQKSHGENVKGILLMQDWGTCEEEHDLDAAVKWLDSAIDKPETSKDKTIQNLFSTQDWQKAITSGELIVSNAVWGVREKRKCGYLGNQVHKQAFFTWGKVVAKLHDQLPANEKFRLLLAGEWARFDGQRAGDVVELATYMKDWNQWTSNGKDAVNQVVNPTKQWGGCVVFLNHPSVWNALPRLYKNPFADLSGQ